MAYENIQQVQQNLIEICNVLRGDKEGQYNTLYTQEATFTLQELPEIILNTILDNWDQGYRAGKLDGMLENNQQIYNEGYAAGRANGIDEGVIACIKSGHTLTMN